MASKDEINYEVQLPIGTPLAVGSLVGRVVRIFETGFAVKFVEKQALNDLSRLIIRQDDESTEAPRKALVLP